MRAKFPPTLSLLLPTVALAAAASAQTPLTTVRIIGPGEGVDKPILATAPDGDSRLFIVGESGQVRIYKPGVGVLGTPFVNLGSGGLNLIIDGGGNDERGLLGMAFDPAFATNGRVFFSYTRAGDSASVIASAQVSAGNPDVVDTSTLQAILTVSQPFSNHNGGMIAFGHDGYLYIGFGDGGSGGDPGCRAQDGQELLGKMLRIDVCASSGYSIPPDNPFVGDASVRDEIWHIGLRNPWRWSFDRVTGDMFIGDVGQSGREEVSFGPAGVGGLNFGWKIMEGNNCFSTAACPGGLPSCNSPLLTDPIYDYQYSCFGGSGCVTGGFIYRGCAIPDLQRTYFFSDWCSAQIWSFKTNGTTISNFTNRTAELAPGGAQSISSIAGFGQDGFGELYICDRNGDEVFKIVAASPVAGADCDSNGQIDSCELVATPDVDLSGDGILDACQSLSLTGDVGTVSACSGGTQNLTLDAGAGNGGDIYLLVGSASGITPGFPVDSIVLPLVVDVYTLYTVANPNPPLAGSFGTLSGGGTAAAAWSVNPGQLTSGQVGTVLNHAYVLFNGVQFDFASNPIRLTIVN